MEKDDVTAMNSYSHNTRNFEEHGGKHKPQGTSVVLLSTFPGRGPKKKGGGKSTANIKTDAHIGSIKFGFRTISVSQKEWDTFEICLI